MIPSMLIIVQKGIKCDITLYPIFKDDWRYDSWYHNTDATASVHGIEEVFDFHYPLIVLRKYQYFGTTRWLKQCCIPPRPLQSTSYEHFHCLPNS